MPVTKRDPANVEPSTNGHKKNGHMRTAKVNGAGGYAPLAQAIAVRDSLRETLVKTRELIRAIKREKKHSQIVASTLASLKQLQSVA
jgi:hypothetical protein